MIFVFYLILIMSHHFEIQELKNEIYFRQEDYFKLNLFSNIIIILNLLDDLNQITLTDKYIYNLNILNTAIINKESDNKIQFLANVVKKQNDYISIIYIVKNWKISIIIFICIIIFIMYLSNLYK